jgi:hypothetical protein
MTLIGIIVNNGMVVGKVYRTGTFAGSYGSSVEVDTRIGNFGVRDQ